MIISERNYLRSKLSYPSIVTQASGEMTSSVEQSQVGYDTFDAVGMGERGKSDI